MATIRTHKKENPFVMLDKRPLEDTRLSWEAKGLHSYLMSKPDNWTVNIKHLVKQSRNGRDATYRIVNELIAAGYIERHQEQGEDGKFGDLEYIVHELPTHFDPFELPKTTRKPKETPHPENQETVKEPHPEKPDTGNTYISNKEVSNNDLNNKKDDDDNAHTRDSINLQIFEKYKEQITPEQFAVVLERIPADKETVNYKSYLITSVEREIKEIARKQNESAQKQQAAADMKHTNEKKKTARNKTVQRASHLKVIPPMPSSEPGQEVSEDDFEKMMELARQLQSEKTYRSN